VCSVPVEYWQCDLIDTSESFLLTELDEAIAAVTILAERSGLELVLMCCKERIYGRVDRWRPNLLAGRSGLLEFEKESGCMLPVAGVKALTYTGLAVYCVPSHQIGHRHLL
jgi:hypothetical protein